MDSSYSNGAAGYHPPPQHQNPLESCVERMEHLAMQQQKQKKKNPSKFEKKVPYQSDYPGSTYQPKPWRGRGRGRGRGFHNNSFRGNNFADPYQQQQNNPYQQPQQYPHNYQAYESQFQDASERPPKMRYKNKPRPGSGVSSASNLTASQLAKSLSELPEFEATLLNLIDTFDFDHKEVKSIVHANRNIFTLEEEKVKLTPSIKICPNHLLDEGCDSKLSCRDLHICHEYVSKKCQDKNCLCGHDLQTNHNRKVLKCFHFDLVPIKIVLNLLRKTDGPLEEKEELKICEDYNEGKCQNENDCLDLHLCLEYLARNCSSQSDCELSHNFTGKQVSSVLKSCGILLNESPKDIFLTIVSKPRIKDQLKAIEIPQTTTGNQKTLSKDTDNSSTEDEQDMNDRADVTPMKEEKPQLKTVWSHEFLGEVTKDEICFNSVDTLCPYEDSGCWRLHSSFHFYWQVRAANMKWANLCVNQVNALEIAYCDPTIERVMLPPLDPSTLNISCKKLLLILNGRSKWEGNFNTMELTLAGQTKVLELRRLCTENVPNKSFAPCTFKWFFLDKNSKWIEYGNMDSTREENLKADVGSNDIEQEYQQNPNSIFNFKNASFSYALDFQKMTQTNLQTNVSRAVRRRPTPHLTTKKKVVKAQKNLPSWEDMNEDERVRRVTLSPSSDEHKKVIDHINKQGGGLNVLKIERVQNPYLLRAFQNKVQELTLLYKDKSIVNIMQLFHGTKPEIVVKICEENFDWRLHGTSSGQSFGRGTYFSPVTSTSNNYSSSDANGNKFMFIAQVAVGTITTGNSGMARPPNNPQYNVAFDSTANATVNPTIIVKYDKQEYYPEYIITYQ